MDYDWDSLDVGNPWMNTSQNFFRAPHVLHERNSWRGADSRATKTKSQQHKLGQEKQTTGILKYCSAANGPTAAKSGYGGNMHNKENSTIMNQQQQAARNCQIPVNVSRFVKSNSTATADDVVLRQKFKKSMKISGSEDDTMKFRIGAHQPNPPPLPHRVRHPLRKSMSSDTLGSRLFEYAEIARKKKEQLALKYQHEQEQKLKFAFHAQPVPKFVKSSSLAKLPVVEKKLLVKQMSLPQVNTTFTTQTKVPNCGDPERIKFLAEKKKSLVEKYDVKQSSFRAKPAVVLKQQPFQPTYQVVKKPEAKPFKLHLSDRLSQRQEFNRKNHEIVSKKRSEEEMKKRQIDSEAFKLIRQKTEFKARPNPFRHGN